MDKQNAQSALRGIDIKDSIEIKACDGFFYKIIEDTKVDTGWNKKPEDGWLPLDNAMGDYCGFNGMDKDDFNIKIRIQNPFSMVRRHGHYITLPVSTILSIKK